LSLPLPPTILWGIDLRNQNFALLFIDSIEPEGARYRTIDGSDYEGTEDVPAEFRRIVAGEMRDADSIVLVDGRSLAHEWAEIREHREEAGRRNEGRVNWAQLDQPTLKWFAGLLEPASQDPTATVQQKLLDGRSYISPQELRQLSLLFGTPPDVRRELQRDVLDLRVIDEESFRPTDRELAESDNLFAALRKAVQFFATHTGMGAVAPEDLRETSGSLNYLTLREVLVNQMIHQDYEDHTAAGQIEIQSTKLTVFNTGYSLVDPDKLLDGGKHQCRNPLIARALRLIGFAEISGSGIRAVHRACQEAHRKAPIFESDRTTNSFTLTLDWSDAAVSVDSYWQTLVGASLTQEQVAVLDVIAGDSSSRGSGSPSNETTSVTVTEIEELTTLDTETVSEALDYLELQVLIQQDESSYRLADHLRAKLR
jgi:hypothetical protein